MGNNLFQSTGTQSLLALIGKTLTASAAPAAPAATGIFHSSTVQDGECRERNFYQAVNSCSNVSESCVITFPTVPAGKRLIVEHVSATAVMPEANTLFHFVLRGGNAFQFLPTDALSDKYRGQYRYTVNENVFAVYDGGQAPHVDALVATSAPFTVEACLSGYTIDVP